MASSNGAPNTDVDELAVNAIIQNQITTKSNHIQQSNNITLVNSVNNNNNSAIVNVYGGGPIFSQKHHHGIAHGELISTNNNNNSDNIGNKTFIITSSANNNNSNIHNNNIITTNNSNTFVNHILMPGGQPQQQQQIHQQQQQQHIQNQQHQRIINNTSNHITTATKVGTSNMPKNEPVKLVYPAGVNQQGSILNMNNRVTLTSTSLPNGTISLSQLSQPQTTMQAGGTTIKTVQSHQYQNQQPTLIIKNQGVPSSVINSNAPGIVTMTKTINNPANTQNIVGTQVLPASVQLVNVRPSGQQQGHTLQTQQQKTVATVSPRVVIGAPQLVGTRQNNTNVTLSALQHLQHTQPGQTLLVKSESGQFQLLRIGPAPTAQQLQQNNMTGTGNQTIRLQTVPAVSRFTGPPLALRKTIVTQQHPISTAGTQGTIIVNTSVNTSAPTGQQNIIYTTQATPPVASVAPMPNLATQHQNTTVVVATGQHHQQQQLQQQQQQQQQHHPPQLVTTTTAVTAVAPTVNANVTANQRTTMDNTKEKCRKFLTNLIELSKREPRPVERNVRTLIQELVDANVEPEEFCERLERLLNASPQPCLIGFLKKSLPLLRQSLVSKEIVIEGINAPSASVAFTGSTITTQIPAQIRPIVTSGTIGQTQIRMITQQTVPKIGQTTIRPASISTVRIQNPIQTAPTAVTTSGPRLVNSNVVVPQIRGQTTIVQTTQNHILAAPPALHPVSAATVLASTGQIRTPATINRSQTTLQIRTAAPNAVQSVVRNNSNSIAGVTTKPSLVISQTNQNQNQIKVGTPQIKQNTTTINNNINNNLKQTTIVNCSNNNLNNISIHNNNNNNSNSNINITNSNIINNKTITAKSQSTAASHKHHTAKEAKEKKNTLSTIQSSAAAASYYQPLSSVSASVYGDDDINDVAAMGGVNLAEETQRILGSTEFVGTQIRSCKDEVFLNLPLLQSKIRQIVSKHCLEDASPDVAVLVSHATQERLKNIVEKLAVIAEHRMDILKIDARYEITKDVRGQIKFLEELDKAEQKRHEEQEREMLIRAAKSRSKTEDPEHAKLKAKAREMQNKEMEEIRYNAANLTALQAIGPRKKQKLDTDVAATTSISTGLGTTAKSTIPLRPRIKRVNLRDLVFYLEQEKDNVRSTMLYKSYLK